MQLPAQRRPRLLRRVSAHGRRSLTRAGQHAAPSNKRLAQSLPSACGSSCSGAFYAGTSVEVDSACIGKGLPGASWVPALESDHVCTPRHRSCDCKDHRLTFWLFRAIPQVLQPSTMLAVRSSSRASSHMPRARHVRQPKLLARRRLQPLVLRSRLRLGCRWPRTALVGWQRPRAASAQLP